MVPHFGTKLDFAAGILRGSGIEPHVIAGTPGRAEEAEHVVPQILGLDATQAEVTRAVRAARPDLMIVQNCPPLSRFAQAAAARRFVRVVGYDLLPLAQPRPRVTGLRGWLSGAPSRWITPVPGLDRSQPAAAGVSLLPWPVATEAGLGARPPRPDGRLRIVCVGRLAQRRNNQPLLVDAIRSARLEDRVHLTLVGNSSLGAAGSDALQLGVLRALGLTEDWITLREDPARGELPALLAASDVCVLAATGEPLGVVPLEGMAYGTVPVISVDAGSAGMVEPGRNGLRIDMRDVQGIGRQLLGLLEEPGLLERLSRGAQATAAREMAPEVYLGRIRELMGLGA